MARVEKITPNTPTVLTGIVIPSKGREEKGDKTNFHEGDFLF